MDEDGEGIESLDNQLEDVEPLDVELEVLATNSIVTCVVPDTSFFALTPEIGE